MSNKSLKSMYKTLAGGILIVIGLSLVIGARRFPNFANWYSEHIYKFIVRTVGRFFGLFPFSVAEVGIGILLLWFVVYIGVLAVRMLKGKSKKEILLSFISSFILSGGIIFFLYVLNCGINYERNSFTETAYMKMEVYGAEELREVSLWLTKKLNETSVLVKRDENGVMQLGENETQGAVDAITSLGKEYPELDGYYPKPKGLCNSWVLSIQNLTGIYLPFTVEANYNHDMTAYNIPFTACHELSHLSGFMQEEEANFIAWLASSHSERVDFQYSGWLLGWIYCTNVLDKIDVDASREVRELLSDAVVPDLKANNQFWSKYDGRIAEVANQVNDTYLKANGQQDGVQSYSRMVDLIVAYYMENELK